MFQLEDCIAYITSRGAKTLAERLEDRLSLIHILSVAGFGGYDESALLKPPLTTLKFDSYTMGYLCLLYTS